MSEVQILPCKPGTINADDKATLSSAGIIVIEVDEPASLRLISAGQDVSAAGMLYAAMKAMSGDQSQSERSKFALEISKQVCDNWTARQKPSTGAQP